MEVKFLYIEFIGPPGAGKTTLCSALRQKLEKKNMCVSNKISFKHYSFLKKVLICFKLIPLLNFHILTFLTLKSFTSSAIKKQKGLGWKKNIIKFYLFLNYSLRKKPKSTKRIFLKDQGILQEIIGDVLFLNIIKESKAIKIINSLLPPPENVLLVFVGINKKKSIIRQKKRSKIIYHLYDLHGINKFLKIEKNLKKILIKKYSYIYIDGSWPIDKNVKLINQKIETFH